LIGNTERARFGLSSLSLPPVASAIGVLASSNVAVDRR
jgi:hypothetical protein